MEIRKTFTAEVAHRLHLMPEGHRCFNFHGHSYSITIVISSLSMQKETGVILDFGELVLIKNWIDNNLDHRVIISNSDVELIVALSSFPTAKTILPIPHTTSELLADYMSGIFMEILKSKIDFAFEVKVIVSETPKTSATASASTY
jgi:6-pyruvoyl-tetrahydropterin synthase